MLAVSTCLLSVLMLLGPAPHTGTEKQSHVQPPQTHATPQSTPGKQRHSDWEEGENPEKNLAQSSQPTFAETTNTRELTFDHSNKLEPLDTRLWSHKNFDAKVLTEGTHSNHWYRVPQWLGGTWHTDSETTLEEIDLRFGTRNMLPFTVKHKENWIFGMQMDAQGTLWQFVRLPHRQQVCKPDRSELRLVTQASFSSNARGTELMLKSQCISIAVENFTNIISAAHKEEIIERLYPISPTEAREFLSVKTFDVDGTPIWMSRSVRTLRKVKVFSPVPQYEGHNLVSLFKEFLNSTDMGCLSGSQPY